MLILSSPFGGTANGTATPDWSGQNDSVPVNLTESNGSAAGIFVLDRWSLQPLTNQLILGAGRNSPCSSTDRAVVSSHGIPFMSNGTLYHSLLLSLLPSGTKSDATEPARFNYSGYASVVFGLGFQNNAGGAGTCYGLGFGTTLSQAGIDFALPVADGNTTTMIQAHLGVSLVDHYYFPGIPATPGGVWLAMVTPAGGEEFEWSPCS